MTEIRLLNQKAYKISGLQRVQLPFLAWLVALSSLIACSIGGVMIFGFNIRGYVWFLQLIISVFILLQAPTRVSFPWYLWLPWISMIILYQIFSNYPNSLQRSLMLLCPIMVGAAVSTIFIRERELEGFRKLCRYIATGFIVIALLKTGVLLTGALPEITGLAGESMTAALLATLFAADYASGRRGSLSLWVSLAAVPIIAITRTAIVATGLTLPLTLGPLRMAKRAMILILLGTVGIGLFYTERIQRKMFYSGEGTIAEVGVDNPNLRTAGRTRMWELMKEKIKEKPWLGHGANAQENFIFSAVGFYGQPHNDWMRLFFDYGYVGAFIFGSCLLMQFLHAWRKGRMSTGETRVLFYAGASSFLPFVLFMLTDNIILYTAFFGSLQFTILGMAYAAFATSIKDALRMRIIDPSSLVKSPIKPHRKAGSRVR